jgi:pyridoxine 4-dehydrogenase
MSPASESPSASAAGELTLGGDLPVNRMGFGAMRITGEGIWGDPPNPEGARAVLRRVVELDVNLIDTADSYGPEVSERLIREALHPYPEGVVIATKGGLLRDGPGQWRPDCRPERLREACERSLRRLRLDRIDLYQLHMVDREVPLEESVGALAELRAEGKIRHVGLSNVDAGQLAKGREIVPVVSVQNRYSMSSRDSEEVLKACERDDLGFIPWFPLDTGSLAAGEGRIEEIARTHDATPAQVALAWLLRRPYRVPIIPIVGARKLSQVQDNLACVEVQLSSDHLARLDEASRIELGFPHDFFTKEMVKGFTYGGMRDRIDARPR